MPALDRTERSSEDSGRLFLSMNNVAWLALVVRRASFAGTASMLAVMLAVISNSLAKHLSGKLRNTAGYVGINSQRKNFAK